MNILITGANGQLGTAVARALRAGETALGPIPDIYRGARAAGVDLPQWDLADREATLRLTREARPDLIFHCAAFTRVDDCERDPAAAFRGNALAARNVALAAQETGAKLVHLSTDYVFDGTAAAPIPEWTPPNPRSEYGRTKLLGEEYVRDFCARHFIVRTAWLYGPGGNNFVETMLRLAREKESIQVVDDQLGNPTHAEDLAHHLLLLGATGEYGLYHITGGGICSWNDFAAEIVRLSGEECRVLPCSTAEYIGNKEGIAPRPAYSALAHHMLDATVGDHMRDWRTAVQAAVSEMLGNK